MFGLPIILSFFWSPWSSDDTSLALGWIIWGVIIVSFITFGFIHWIIKGNLSARIITIGAAITVISPFSTNDFEGYSSDPDPSPAILGLIGIGLVALGLILKAAKTSTRIIIMGAALIIGVTLVAISPPIYYEGYGSAPNPLPTILGLIGTGLVALGLILKAIKAKTNK